MYWRSIVPLLMLALCAAPLAAGGRSTLSEHIKLVGDTESHEYELNVPDEAAGARMVFRAKVKSGEISCKLIDSHGEERLSGHGVRGNFELDTGQLEHPTSGVWRLEIDLRRARGHYRVEWHSE